LFHWDSFRPGHRPTPDRSGVIGNRTGQLVGKVSV